MLQKTREVDERDPEVSLACCLEIKSNLIFKPNPKSLFCLHVVLLLVHKTFNTVLHKQLSHLTLGVKVLVEKKNSSDAPLFKGTSDTIL